MPRLDPISRANAALVVRVLPLLVGACGESPIFLPPPPGDGALSFLAAREADKGPFWLGAADFDTSHLELAPDSVVFALEYETDPRLPRDRRLERGDFGTANCEVMQPTRVWEASLIEPADWHHSEAPEPVTRILTALAQEDCHRCVRFEETRIDFGFVPRRIEGVADLSSGAKLVSLLGHGLVRALPSGETEPLTGCDSLGLVLSTAVGPNEFVGAYASRVVRIAIDEAEARCTTLSSTVVPGTGLFAIEASLPDEPFEAFMLDYAPDAQGNPGPLRRIHRYSEAGVEQVSSFDFFAGEEADLVRLGPEEALFSTGHQRVIHWKSGVERELVMRSGRDIPGMVRLSSGRVLGFSSGPSSEGAAHTFNRETGQFELLDLVRERALSAGTFRGGFVVVTRAGEFYEYHGDAFCPVSTALGNRGNHAPRFVQEGRADSIVVDMDGDQLSWLHPLPPDPPSELEF